MCVCVCVCVCVGRRGQRGALWQDKYMYNVYDDLAGIHMYG